jgi:nucleoid-associated protein YgaU
MPLEKLTIKPEEGEPITVCFNPERYTLNKGVQIAEIAIPGLDSPVLQFVRGQNEKITLELFFDTTTHGMVDNVKDVREETKKIYHLLKINKKTHAPPRCTLLWGEGGQLFSFDSFPEPQCVLESVSEEFNLFSPSGVPLRAKLNVTFREYKSIEDQIKEINKESSDRTKIFEVERGQTLSQIAWLEYQDPNEWRRIAEANKIENPRLLTPGSKLRIPRISPEGA